MHAFHSYPARLHSLTARRLLERLSPGGGLVLDPFCGSSTVIVEARLSGRRATGIDANPLAVELSWLKTRGSTENERAALGEGARIVAEHADDRRHRKAGATHRYGREDTELFEPHVLMELDGLRAGLGKVRHDFARRALRLVLSAILVKVSRRTGDTSEGTAPRRLSAGYTTKLFYRKAEGSRLSPSSPPCFRATLPSDVRWGDARKLDGVDAPRSTSSSHRHPIPATTITSHTTRFGSAGWGSMRNRSPPSSSAPAGTSPSCRRLQPGRDGRPSSARCSQHARGCSGERGSWCSSSPTP